MKDDIQQQRANYSTLWHSGVRGMKHLLFHVSGFEPLSNQLPSREIANGLQQGGVSDIIKCTFYIGI